MKHLDEKVIYPIRSEKPDGMGCKRQNSGKNQYLVNAEMVAGPLSLGFLLI